MRIIERMTRLTVELTIDGYFTDSEEVKVRDAVRHMAIALNSDEFKDFVLNFSWEQTVCTGSLWWKTCYKKIVPRFNWNDGLTNRQVYDRIISGNETLNPGNDNTANVVLRIDRRRSRGIIGYTYPNTVTQWVYSWFLNSSYREVSGNLSHEWTHKLGFDHAFRYSWDRQFTVPYAIGYFVSNFKIN
jgi:hypothetical protein